MTILAVCALLTLATLAWKLRGARKDVEHWKIVARASDDARKKAHSLLRTRRYVDKVMRDERKRAERTGLTPCERFGHAIPNRHGERVCGRCWKTEAEITRERSDR